MELELISKKESMVGKLDKMKDILCQGQVVDKSKFESAMGSELKMRKKQHNEMMQKQLSRLANDQRNIFQHRDKERKTIKDYVEKSERNKGSHQGKSPASKQAQLSKQSTPQLKQLGMQSYHKALGLQPMNVSMANKQVSKGKPYQELLNMHEQAKMASKQKVEPDFEELSDCSAEVPLEASDEEEEKKEATGQAAAYKSNKYNENYHQATLFKFKAKKS